MNDDIEKLAVHFAALDRLRWESEDEHSRERYRTAARRYLDKKAICEEPREMPAFPFTHAEGVRADNGT